MSSQTNPHKRSHHIITSFILIALLAALIPALQPAMAVHADGEPASYIILSKKNTLPDNLADEIANAGGTLTSTMPEIGVAVATSTAPSFAADAAKIKGIQSVTRDVSVQWVDGQGMAWSGQNFAWTGQDFSWTGQDISDTAQTNPAAAAGLPDLSLLQWNLEVISAPQAHDVGAKGAGVRVAVLDTGFDLSHPDFMRLDSNGIRVGNLDLAAARSFVPGEDVQFNPFGTDDVNIFSHGTHVAGIIAAVDNGFGVTGVAPEATIVPVKVLRDSNARGNFAWITAGIYYAASQDVDVINMSLGAALPRDGFVDDSGIYHGAQEIAALINSMKRATDYAAKRDITIIAAAGNIEGPDFVSDMDHAGNLYYLPADLPSVLAISATGPVGLAFDPNANLDDSAFYTRYGQSFVDFAAPGGNTDPNFFIAFLRSDIPCDPSSIPLCTGIENGVPIGVFDWVWSTNISTFGPNYAWLPQIGTSMAAPHAAGIAALIIGQNGGSMKPSHVERELRQSADDLGKPGNDDFYGGGRLNALRAVQ